MRHEDEAFMRRLSLGLTTFALVLSLLTTYILQYMPNDPLHLRRNFTIYSVFVLFVSAAGFVGAWTRNPTLLSLFASHLLLDSILYLIPRVILLNFSISLPTLLCSPSYPSTRNDEVYRVHQTQRVAQRFLSSRRCRSVSWAVECCVVSGALLAMILQFWLGLKLRRYAQYLDRRALQAKMDREAREKAMR
ncbi:uncharacterized protein PV09_07828 [Verruconis gallopava]|uniref:Uncharacterized protein n=1 Tax=Verruconis gallopava TaxID=253628 RepID=A0A0D2AND4_9PEZI|nr:uncharacterized protein PV09_07828 [Verruconis gallopava]KIW00634.1 hypothetical protein PV09_07828 [Verruconis gallopava]